MGAEFTTLAVTVRGSHRTGIGILYHYGNVTDLALVAVPVAVNLVDETRVVVSTALPNWTAAPVAKCAPFTVSVNVPTGIDVGATVVTCGVGLFTVTALPAVFVASVVSTAVIVTAPPLGGNSGAT